jgi:hypothetical protein
MSDIDWDEHTDEEVIRARKTAPRIFGPWTPWDRMFGGDGYAWSRREVFPGPSYRSGGHVSVQRNTGMPGYGVSWWADGREWYENHFATPEEAMARGDEWLMSKGHRLQTNAGATRSSDEGG